MSRTRGKREDISQRSCEQSEKVATTESEFPSRLIDATDQGTGRLEGQGARPSARSHKGGVGPRGGRGVEKERRSGVVPRWADLHGETYRSVVMLTFAKGASLKDPSGLFNSSLECNTGCATDLRKDEEVDEDAFRMLIRAAGP
jgi:hypothetical protein